MALTKVGKEGITGISNSSNANAITIDSSENVGIGTASPSGVLHTAGSGDQTVTLQAGGESKLEMKIDGNSDGCSIRFSDSDAASQGQIRYQHSTDALSIYTNGNNERLRVDSSGNVLVGKTATGDTTAGFEAQASGRTTICRSGSQPLNVSRIGSDGTLVAFLAQGTEEGQITVSGTTVSYNGGHLARFSQATDGNRIDGLVKGTVMTNLDQMAVWTKDGVTEDNEQLNCMAVSSVEGDANVAGVFVNWDDDDEDYTSDMNIAMTGDMVIRIASGTTVARGDLLMSAGDGTAKPQDDDIVRSKTIAKVTSTTKSHTYDDGSYLVPCVLMAC